MPFNANTLIGQTIGGYHLDRVLGTGGAGIVYLAHVPDQPDQQVAIKLLVPPGQMTESEQEEFRRRFLREAATLTRLRHPHILAVQTVDEDEANGLVYMVMDYLPGGTLADRLNQGPLPLPQVCDYVTQLADALDYAHGLHVVHRDLKPANVLLDEQGQVYLADFGIAKLLDVNATTITNVNQAIGTPGYMAPEQITNEPVSPATDVYGLGVLTYQMVTGRIPFDSPSLLSLMRQITMEDPPPPRNLRPDLPVAAANVLLRALAKRPAERFASAGGFALAFDRGLQGKDITPSPQTLLTQPEMAAVAFAQRDDAPLAVSGVNQRITNAWPVDQSPKQKRRRGVLIVAVLLTVAAMVAMAVFLPGVLASGKKQAGVVHLAPTATGTTAPTATTGPAPTATAVPPTATTVSNPGQTAVPPPPPTKVPTATPVPPPPLSNFTVSPTDGGSQSCAFGTKFTYQLFNSGGNTDIHYTTYWPGASPDGTWNISSQDGYLPANSQYTFWIGLDGPTPNTYYLGFHWWDHVNGQDIHGGQVIVSFTCT